MWKGMGLGKREQQTMWDLNGALGASLDLHSVLKDAYRLLLPLVGADYGALAVTWSERAGEYEWIAENLPPAFFGSYEAMAPHDFVHSSVQAKMQIVVCDSEMIDRRAFERNMMYHRARELGSPIEQVIAVMLHASGGLQSGLSLYRKRRRPFTEREQRMLQLLTPAIANAVRNCWLFAKEARPAKQIEMVHPAPQVPTVLDARLTPRERQVVSAIIRGLSNHEIAEELGCSLNTVKKHVQHIFEKLGVESRQMLRYRARRGA
ncbi:LuxR C-terminal-related transcriptional regulator [Sorangium atrum]|uniref:LuxR C-terminal-related transcriptional regulator n=1 Tax=Sorangium atrum TaxID=2995308 RepID=A0ABT5BXM2_9BACT|nr:LuxR C-terminal-related transcriptional regulator [Sorangium aterium]MDC0678284.1 LuxR C-terminal-related transcriptional regulator [Sorangium aterium]